MASRKQFVATAAASIGAMMAQPQAAAAQSAASPQPSPSPSPSPSPTAHELALRMRAFDPQLTDAEIESIAEGIEGNLKLGTTIDPKGRALKNSDEPVPAFSA